MFRYNPSVCFFILLYVASAPVLAGWSHGQASMAVGDAPLDQIRTQTIKNAIADAAYKAGAMITAEDIMLNGLLVESSVSLKAHGEIKRIEVLDEQLSNDVLTVWVKADLTTYGECEQSSYKQTLLISQIRVQNTEQAAVGSLFELGQHVSKRIEQQIRAELPGVNTQLLNQPFTLFTAVQGLSQRETASKADYLARTYGAQYILYGVIRDLSMQNQIEEGFFSDSEYQRRSFTLRLYLMDNFSRKVVFENSYHTQNEWPFELTQVMDLNSSLFWQSQFGRSLLNQLNSAVIDISEKIQCRNVLLPIMSIGPEGVWIGAGEDSGVKLGDTFKLLRLSTSFNAPTLSVLKEINDSKMKVIALNEFSALLEPTHLNLATEARIFDLLSPD